MVFEKTSTDHLAGEMIADLYRLEEPLGTGGFGTVYRATQVALGREVALKLLHEDRLRIRRDADRFTQEAQLAQQLEHPNTVRLYDYGQTENGLLYIAYELLRGHSLETVLNRESPLPPARMTRIASQVLKSLMDAHQHGIVHRDIKPDNIFIVDFTGERDFVKLLDFGIAKPVGPTSNSSKLTGEDEIIGTASYMAPEQVLGEPVSPATDLYALGLVMAEMLTGRVVYLDSKPIRILAAHLSDDPTPIDEAILASPLGPVIDRATRKNQHERFREAEHMLMELERAASQLSTSGAEMPLNGVDGDRISWHTMGTNIGTDPTAAASSADLAMASTSAASSTDLAMASTSAASSADLAMASTSAASSADLAIASTSAASSADLARGVEYLAPVPTPPSASETDFFISPKLKRRLVAIVVIGLLLGSAGGASLFYVLNTGLFLPPRPVPSYQPQTAARQPLQVPTMPQPVTQPPAPVQPAPTPTLPATPTPTKAAPAVAPSPVPPSSQPVPWPPSPEKVRALTPEIIGEKLQSSGWAVLPLEKMSREINGAPNIHSWTVTKGAYSGSVSLRISSDASQAQTMVTFLRAANGATVVGGTNILYAVTYHNHTKQLTVAPARELISHITR